jgi:hypothetical protein
MSTKNLIENPAVQIAMDSSWLARRPLQVTLGMASERKEWGRGHFGALIGSRRLITKTGDAKMKISRKSDAILNANP